MVNPRRAVEPMSAKVKESFKKRVARGDKHPLLWALHETYFWEFWLGGFFQLSSSILQVISPFTLRFLIQFATDAYVAAQTGGPAPAHRRRPGARLRRHAHADPAEPGHQPLHLPRHDDRRPGPRRPHRPDL